MPDQTTDTTDVEPAAEVAAAPDVEPLGEPGRKALTVEREARKAAEAQTRDLRDQLAALQRAEVARTRGLPAALADRLQGDTLGDLEADADRIAEDLADVLARRTGPPASRNQGADATGPPTTSVQRIADALHSPQW